MKTLTEIIVADVTREVDRASKFVLRDDHFLVAYPFIKPGVYGDKPNIEIISGKPISIAFDVLEQLGYTFELETELDIWND